MLIAAIVFIGVIACVVFEQQGHRRIPAQYAKRIVGRRVYGSQSTHIPFKINPAGVIPVIFASSVIMVPGYIAQFAGERLGFFSTISVMLTPPHLLYLMVYTAMVIFFTYFYTFIQFNPADIADNMKRSGGFIPGIRPGTNTAKYLERVLNRITLAGALFLAFIAVFPDIINKLWGLGSIAYLLGGTSLLIMIGVDLDTMKQIESHLLTRHYEGFLKKGKIRGRSFY